MNAVAIAETSEAKKNFYPTPESLATRLLSGIEWYYIENVLEPSAGKGDLALYVDRMMRDHHNRFHYRDTPPNIDCVEIDSNLRSILQGKGLRVVGSDFLSFRTFKRYHLIVMNPPFDRGAEHLLKALEMQERGGAVRCILNAETLRNPCTYARQKLAQLLRQYDATIEYVEGAFSRAERKTDVEVALVSVKIPEVKDGFSSILDELNRDIVRRKEEAPPEQNKVAKSDYISAAVDRFNYEIEAGIRLIREFNVLRPYLTQTIDGNEQYTLISLMMGGSASGSREAASENAYVRAVRLKYWGELFKNPEFTKNLTSNLLNKLRKDVDKMVDYDFSEYNIYALMVETQKNLVTGIEQTIIGLFDDWTRKYHWDENSQNRHYFDGWRTNDAFKVNKKVIIPFRCVWDGWSGRYEPNDYTVRDKLNDIEKVFDFLGGTSGSRIDLASALRTAQETGQSRKIPLTYFNVTFYKKGTCHIEFTDEDVLKKFNLFAARGKNWLPPCYGKKRYKDMTKEEKAVIDSYEGEKSYQEVLDRAEYFLDGPKVLSLTSGE